MKKKCLILILNNLKKEEQMTNIVDMTSVAEGNTSALDKTGITTTTVEESTKIEAKELPEGTMMEITQPGTDKVYTFPALALAGGDFHQVIQASDDTIPEEDIKRYHDIALDLLANKGRVHLGSGDIEQDWVQEIWDEVNPSPGKGACVLHRHYLNGHSAGQSGGIHVDAWTGNQYTVIVYLTPDWRPEDGGSLELWTPNLNDEQRAMAINTPYGFGKGRVPEMNIIKSYWPRTGRVVVFDSRLPSVARAVEGDKFRVSLVFKCQLIRNHIL